jgi:hypothetical protein
MVVQTRHSAGSAHIDVYCQYSNLTHYYSFLTPLGASSPSFLLPAAAAETSSRHINVHKHSVRERVDYKDQDMNTVCFISVLADVTYNTEKRKIINTIWPQCHNELEMDM